MASTRAIIAGYALLIVAALCGGFVLVSPFIEYASILSSVSVALYVIAYSIVPITIKILGKKNMRRYIIITAVLAPIAASTGIAATCVSSLVQGLPSIVMCTIAAATYVVSGIVIGGRYIQGGTRASMWSILATWMIDVIKDMKEKGFLPDKFMEKAESLGLLGIRHSLDPAVGAEMKTIRREDNPPAKKEENAPKQDDESFTSSEDEPATTTIPIPPPLPRTTTTTATITLGVPLRKSMARPYIGPLPLGDVPGSKKNEVSTRAQ
jgi:hypothetical protein